MARHIPPRPSPPETFNRGLEMVVSAPIVISAPVNSDDALDTAERIKLLRDELRSQAQQGASVQLLRIDRRRQFHTILYFAIDGYIVSVRRFENRRDNEHEAYVFENARDVYASYRVHVVAATASRQLIYHPLASVNFFRRQALVICKELHADQDFRLATLARLLPGDSAG